MSALITIDTAIIGKEEVNSVNARELHTTLEVKKDFSDWIKAQIKSLNLEESIDYIATPLKRGIANGGYKMITEYILTLDTAKHIAMASRTKKGKELRAYFIEVEKQFKIGVGQYKELESQKEKLERKYYEQLELSNKLLLERLQESENKKEKRKAWSKEELQELERLYSMGLNYTQIGKRLNRKPESVASKVRTYIKGKK